MSAAPILRVDRLSKNFRGLAAIAEVSFAIEPGSITSIIGPNGAGKSTLFNLVTGYLPPSAGEIQFQGRRITGMATNRIAELGIARAFQIARPFRDLHGLASVAVGSREIAEDHRQPRQKHAEERQAERAARRPHPLCSLDPAPLPGVSLGRSALEGRHAGEGKGSRADGIVGQSPGRRHHCFRRTAHEPFPRRFEDASGHAELSREELLESQTRFCLRGEP